MIHVTKVKAQTRRLWRCRLHRRSRLCLLCAYYVSAAPSRRALSADNRKARCKLPAQAHSHLGQPGAGSLGKTGLWSVVRTKPQARVYRWLMPQATQVGQVPLSSTNLDARRRVLDAHALQQQSASSRLAIVVPRAIRADLLHLQGSIRKGARSPDLLTDTQRTPSAHPINFEAALMQQEHAHTMSALGVDVTSAVPAACCWDTSSRSMPTRWPPVWATWCASACDTAPLYVRGAHIAVTCVMRAALQSRQLRRAPWTRAQPSAPPHRYRTGTVGGPECSSISLYD